MAGPPSARARSARSRPSTRSSYVDESLFASKQPKRGRAKRAPQPSSGSAVVSADLLRSIKMDPSNPSPSTDSVVVSASQLSAIRNRSRIYTPGETQRMRHNMTAEKEKRATVAKNRKTRMLELEKKRKNKKPQLNDLEIEEQEARNSLLTSAQKRIDEEHDDVKHMDQMVLYAKCMAIRDRQIDEKRQVHQEQEEEQRRLDLMMEVDRLNALKLYQERERRREEAQREGAKQVIGQIEENKRKRMIIEAQKQKDGEEMVARIQELDRQDQLKKLAKIEQNKKLLKDIMGANEAACASKLHRKQEELDEDMRIQEYIRDKQKREVAYESQMADAAHHKQLEVARLRAMQEKAQDTRAELDALRARRAQEQKERQWRQKERGEAARRGAMQEELRVARDEQRAEKERRLAMQAAQERAEFDHVINAFHNQNREMRAKEERTAHASASYKHQLQAQMEHNATLRRQARESELGGGKDYTAETAKQRVKLDAIKQQKIEELQRAGVPQQYTSELRRKRNLADEMMRRK